MAPRKKSDPNSVKVTVFVPQGSVREGDIKKAALLAARDKIPIAAFDVRVDIADASDVKSADGQKGRDYAVVISYTPRRSAIDALDDDVPHTVDTVLAALEPLTPEKLEQVTSKEA